MELTSLSALEPEANNDQVAHESWPGEVVSQGIHHQSGAFPHGPTLVIGEDSTRFNLRIKKEEPMGTASERALQSMSAVKVFVKVNELLSEAFVAI